MPHHVTASQSLPAVVQLEKFILTTATVKDGKCCEQPDGFLLAGGRGAQPVMYNVLTVGG